MRFNIDHYHVDDDAAATATCDGEWWWWMVLHISYIHHFCTIWKWLRLFHKYKYSICATLIFTIYGNSLYSIQLDMHSSTECFKNSVAKIRVAFVWFHWRNSLNIMRLDLSAHTLRRRCKKKHLHCVHTNRERVFEALSIRTELNK